MSRSDQDGLLSPDHVVRSTGQRPQMWVQEAIYGHRFIEEQKPFMLVLEALGVCRARLRAGNAATGEALPMFPGLPEDGTHEAVSVTIPKMEEMRLMLFRGQGLEDLAADETLSDEERLERWVGELNADADKILKKPSAFDYLGSRFRGRFRDLAQGVRILRGLEIDAFTQKRWSSRFLVPRGPYLLLGDLTEDMVSDRRFFGRGGEVVYLMLNRSARAARLAEAVRGAFFSPDDPLDRLARRLGPEETRSTGDAAVGYLPWPHLEDYDRLADDWLAVLDLRGLPAAQKLDPLARLTALNLVRYLAGRSAHAVGDRADPIPLDLLDGRAADLRILSRSHFERLRSVVRDAVEARVRTTLEAEPSWRNAKAASGLPERSAAAKEAIRATFHMDKFGTKMSGDREPAGWLDLLIEEAYGRDRNAIHTLFKPLGENAGLVASRQKVGTWWRGSDDILEALVLANVGETVTIEELAARLYSRYGLVIGPTEAAEAFPERGFDMTSFEENIRAFERKLTGLGYVRRLSDDCAFVSNPFRLGDAA